MSYAVTPPGILPHIPAGSVITVGILAEIVVAVLNRYNPADGKFLWNDLHESKHFGLGLSLLLRHVTPYNVVNGVPSSPQTASELLVAICICLRQTGRTLDELSRHLPSRFVDSGVKDDINKAILTTAIEAFFVKVQHQLAVVRPSSATSTSYSAFIYALVTGGLPYALRAGVLQKLGINNRETTPLYKLLYVKEVTIQVLVEVYDHLVATKPAQLSKLFNDMYPSANTPAVDPSTTPAAPPTGTPTPGRQRKRGKGKRENGQPASTEAQSAQAAAPASSPSTVVAPQAAPSTTKPAKCANCNDAAHLTAACPHPCKLDKKPSGCYYSKDKVTSSCVLVHTHKNPNSKGGVYKP